MILDQIVVVLCRPSHPGNIGSAARAMKTMGINQLSLVSPGTALTDESYALASGASDVLDGLCVFDSLNEAIANCHWVFGLTCRQRELTAPIQNLRDAITDCMSFLESGQKIAMVFGTERFGLSIDESSRCNRLITIPGNPAYSSLNLAQAVQVVAYEFRQQSECFQKPPENDDTCGSARKIVSRLAYEKFYQALQELLEEHYVLQKSPNPERVLRRLRILFDRAAIADEEMDLLRGILKGLGKRSFDLPTPYKKGT